MLFPFHDENPIQRTPWVTFGIIGVNTVIFLGSLRLAPVDQAVLWYGRGFVPARMGQLVHDRPLVVEQKLPDPQRPQLVKTWRMVLQPAPREILLSLATCMFLHGNWLHLIGNMWFLWVFGNNVEDRLGHVTFLLFYLLGGLLASACHWMIEPNSTTPVIGASGAVAAMLGAYAITWPWARVKTLLFLFVFITVVDLPALMVLGVWFLMQLVSATEASRVQMSGGVAWWAHVGGFVAGLALMPALSGLVGAGQTDQRPSDRPEPADAEDFDDYF